MGFEVSETLRLILKKIRAFMQEDVFPVEHAFLNQSSHIEIVSTLQEKREKVKNLGLWSPHLPKKYGGMGLSLSEFAHVSEALGRSPIGHFLFNCQAPDVGNMEILMEYGTDEQKETYLEPLTQGKIHSCFAMTEPEFAGSNPVWMGTSAVKDGDDYVLNGHKWFATAAEGSTFAIVMAITDSDAENRYQRASQIIVPTDTSGFQIENISVMGKPGRNHFSHGEIFFKDCRVPQTSLLGPEGAGFKIAQERLGPGRIHHCMRWIGICERAFKLMCQRAATRELSPGKPLGTRQTAQNWIAESRAEINAARLMVLDAVEKIDREGASASRVDISLIKFFVANVLQNVLDRAIQIHGALGVTDNTPLAFWYGHERAARIYDGADEVHKTVVARRILRDFNIKVS